MKKFLILVLLQFFAQNSYSFFWDSQDGRTQVNKVARASYSYWLNNRAKDIVNADGSEFLPKKHGWAVVANRTKDRWIQLLNLKNPDTTDVFTVAPGKAYLVPGNLSLHNTYDPKAKVLFRKAKTGFGLQDSPYCSSGIYYTGEGDMRNYLHCIPLSDTKDEKRDAWAYKNYLDAINNIEFSQGDTVKVLPELTYY